MTVVNPKSISGINSITMASGSDDLLTIHSNNTTERVRVNNSGDVIVGSGVTLSPDGDIFATGVCTATSFSGDGSALTGIDLGAVTGATGDFSIADKIVHTGDTDTAIRFSGADTITAETGGSERARIDSSGRLMLGTTTEGFAGADELTLATSGSTGITIRSGTSNDGNIYFSDGDDGSSAEYQGYVQYEHAHGRLNVGTEGTTKLKVDGANVNIASGNLSFETSGKGIDFGNASGSASGSSSALLDDYEEGTWTPTLYYSGSGSATLSEALGNYTKIGREVHVMITLTCSAQGSGSGNAYIGGFPFTSGSFSGGRINGTLTYITGFSNLNSQLNIYFGGSGSRVDIFHMNSINPTNQIENVTRSNITDNTTIRGHATYYVD